MGALEDHVDPHRAFFGGRELVRPQQKHMHTTCLHPLLLQARKGSVIATRPTGHLGDTPLAKWQSVVAFSFFPSRHAALTRPEESPHQVINIYADQVRCFYSVAFNEMAGERLCGFLTKNERKGSSVQSVVAMLGLANKTQQECSVCLFFLAGPVLVTVAYKLLVSTKKPST